MSRKALLKKLIEQHPGLPAELAKVSAAANLALMVAESGISRSNLAKKLGWSRARVTQVLSGQSNLTIETIYAVTKAAVYGFDVVFRKAGESVAVQPWERRAALALEMDNEPNLTSWMSRKTMKALHAQFSGAHEFARLDMTLDSSNRASMYEEEARAA